MMKKYIWISALLLFSCGTRKTDLNKSSEKRTEQTQTEQQTTSSSTTETTTQSEYTLSEDILNFGIRPIDGIAAKFVFLHNGQRIEGETTGELNFGSQRRTETGKTQTRHLVQTTYQTHTSYKTHTTYKSLQKAKQTESERSSLAWYVLAAVLGVVVWEFLKGVIPVNYFKIKRS